MRNCEHTIKKTYYFEGKGLHTGTYAHMKLKPAPAGSGIKFRRVDLPGKPVIDAIADNVSNTARSTTISRKETVAVTIEHITSCLFGLGVDNAVIELDNIEVPILDGSARYYVDAIMKDGLVNQGVTRRFLELTEPVEVEDSLSGSWIKVEPAAAPSIDLTVDFGSRIIGVQNVHWDPGVDYASEIGPSRTFCFFHEIEYLFRNNLIKGGDLDNAIVIVEQEATDEQLKWVSQVFGLPDLHVTDDGYLNNLKLNFPDECGRHKLLDLIGDISLVGGYLNAHVTAFKPGHALNTRLAKILRSKIK
ncbi:MAG: UDP-3-O-acyl-N-acetylglucosamine deacetylase [Bacteroidales bacterium]|nr:UDP-3-O-acyl-N-acetylglucosamine deacetylase [Bacteroidales bacterium]